MGYSAVCNKVLCSNRSNAKFGIRFNASARGLIEDHERTPKSADSTKPELSIGDYLKQNNYSNEFIDDYLIVSEVGIDLRFSLMYTIRAQPMTAAIWSTPPDTCALDFPAHTLIRFMHNHHLLQVTGKPKWLTIPGGSYVSCGLFGFIPCTYATGLTDTDTLNELHPSSQPHNFTYPLPLMPSLRHPNLQRLRFTFLQERKNSTT